MAMEVGELYAQVVKSLSAADRIRLATLILNDIPPRAVVDLPYDLEEEDSETERAAWQTLSAAVNQKVWDNPIDAADWDNWQPQKKPNRKTKAGRTK